MEIHRKMLLEKGGSFMISLVNDDMFSVIRRVDVCRETMVDEDFFVNFWLEQGRPMSVNSKRVLLSTANLMLDGPDHARLNLAVK